MANPRKIEAEVTRVISYSDDVKKFRFRPVKRLPFFRPGQFMHLAIDEYDPSYPWPESRVFSIANSPEKKDFADIIVSRKGAFTSRIFNEVKEGSRVWIKLPYGTFNFNEAAGKKIVLVAGGTGITPFISFLEYALDRQPGQNITLCYGIHDPSLLIIGDLLKMCRSGMPGFEFQLYAEKRSGDDPDFDYNEGILPLKEIAQRRSRDEDSIFYISGPPAMIRALIDELQAEGIPDTRIKFDKWE